MRRVFLLAVVFLWTPLVFAGGGGGGGGASSPPPVDTSPINSSPTTYYTLDDLYNYFKENEGNFYYERQVGDDQRPDLVFMPGRSSEFYPVSLKRVLIQSDVKPRYITVRHQVLNSDHSLSTMADGVTLNASTEIQVDWDKMVACPGDIIFTRGNTSAGKLVTTLFSSWTHSAMIWSKRKHLVLESMPEGGVQQNVTDRTWKRIVAYGTKSIDPYFIRSYSWTQEDSNGNVVNFVGYPDAFNAVKRGLDRYKTTPYWPTGTPTNLNSTLDYAKKWSSKADKSSMYCSKLVYWVYKDANPSVDLDSNRTRCYIRGLNDGGVFNATWIGVSPDDVWGALYLSQTPKDLVGPENLTRQF